MTHHPPETLAPFLTRSRWFGGKGRDFTIPEVRRVAEDLRAAHPSWTDRQLHDTMLGYGSPPPRHLRTLLGLPPAT